MLEELLLPCEKERQGTVRENLQMAKPFATEKEMRESS